MISKGSCEDHVTTKTAENPSQTGRNYILIYFITCYIHLASIGLDPLLPSELS